LPPCHSGIDIRVGELREHEVERDGDTLARARVGRHVVLEPGGEQDQPTRLALHLDQVAVEGVPLAGRRHYDIHLGARIIKAVTLALGPHWT
jgi:hypothetical protein